MASTSIPHPLSHLNRAETELARDVLLKYHVDELIEFRQIGLREPPKAELLAFLDLEHRGEVSSTTSRPARLANCQYDVIGKDRVPRYNESVIDLNTQERVKHEVISQDISPCLTM
jgi:primary-amine oxidase